MSVMALPLCSEGGLLHHVALAQRCVAGKIDPSTGRNPPHQLGGCVLNPEIHFRNLTLKTAVPHLAVQPGIQRLYWGLGSGWDWGGRD